MLNCRPRRLLGYYSSDDLFESFLDNVYASWIFIIIYFCSICYCNLRKTILLEFINAVLTEGDEENIIADIELIDRENDAQSQEDKVTRSIQWPKPMMAKE